MHIEIKLSQYDEEGFYKDEKVVIESCSNKAFLKILIDDKIAYLYAKEIISAAKKVSEL